MIQDVDNEMLRMTKKQIAGGLLLKVSGLLIACAAALSYAVPCQALTIVQDGQAGAEIKIATNAPQSVLFAASELQEYVKKVSGATLAISAGGELAPGGQYIFVGESQFTQQRSLDTEGLTLDGFKMVATNNWLALFGRDYKGDKILEGVRHPFTKDVSYNQHLKINRTGEAGTLFAVYHFLEEYCGVRWYMPGDIGEVVPFQPTIAIGDVSYSKSPDFELRSMYAFIFDDDDDASLWYRRVGFGDPYSPNINHSFGTFEKYRDTHPEYFATLSGDPADRIFTDLCLTNEGCFAQWVANARQYFDENPEQKTFPLMPHDNFWAICENGCQLQIDDSMGADGRFSNYVWGYVDKIAKEVQKTHPDKFIGCGAYQTYLKPPENIAHLSTNVAVMIMKTRMNYWNEAEKQSKDAIIDAWAGKADNIYVWEYYNYLLGDGLNDFPVIVPHIISDDLKRLKGISRGEFIESETGYPISKFDFKGLVHLNLYVTAQLLWDADADVDALLNEYYAKFYGPASAEMQNFFTRAEQIWMSQAGNPELLTDPESRHNASEELKAILDAAIAQTGDDVFRQRIQLILSEMQLTKDAWHFDGAKGAVPINDSGALADPSLLAYWKFNEGQGDVFNDASGHGNDGVLNNTEWINYSEESSLAFDGVSSYGMVANSQSISPSENVTVEGWFRWGEATNHVSFGLVFNTSYNYILFNEGGVVTFRIWNESGISVPAEFAESDIVPSQWNHIVGVYDGQKVSIYLNGQLKNSNPLTGNIRPGGKKLYVGRRDLAGNVSFGGLIDEVRIYSRALSAAEIMEHYQLGVDSIAAFFAGFNNYTDDFESYSDYQGAPWAADTELPNWWTGGPLGGDAYEGAWPDHPAGNKVLALISSSAAPHFVIYDGGAIGTGLNRFFMAADILQMYGEGNAVGLCFNMQGDLKTGYKLDLVDMGGHVGWRVVKLQNAASDADFNPPTSSAPYIELNDIATGTEESPLRVQVEETSSGHCTFTFFNRSAPSIVYTYHWSDNGTALVGGYIGVQGNGWAEFYFDNVTIGQDAPRDTGLMFLLKAAG